MSAPPNRLPLIAGNWKMYKTLEEARSLAQEILEGLPTCADREFALALFPPAVCLSAVSELVREHRRKGPAAARELFVGAQNMHFDKEGAYTGEISAEMVRSAGAEAVILGHSERRHVFGERDEAIGKKVRRALETGLRPVLCVGEKIEERDAGRTTEVVSQQLKAGIGLVEDAERLSRVVVAYEPVWAIGTGRTATPDMAQEVHAILRGELGRAFEALGASPEAREKTLILYGGSVKPENAEGLLAQVDIDGALVGGASLKADSFLGICRGCPAGAPET